MFYYSIPLHLLVDQSTPVDAIFGQISELATEEREMQNLPEHAYIKIESSDAADPSAPIQVLVSGTFGRPTSTEEPRKGLENPSPPANGETNR